MTGVAEMFQDGGPVMLLITVAAFIGGPLAVLFALVIGGLKARFPASLGWAGLTLTLVLGLVGTWMGISQATSALSSVAPDQQQTLIAHGVALAMYNTTASMMLTSWPFLAILATAWLPAVLAPGPESRVDGASLGAAFAGALGSTLLGAVVLGLFVGSTGFFDSGLMAMLLPLLSFGAVLAILLSCLRVSEQDEHRARIAGTRAMLGTAGFLGIGLLGETLRQSGIIFAFQAVAGAPAEQKQTLLMMGMEIASYARWIGWSMALVPLTTGLLGAAPHLGKLGGRQFAGIALAAVQVLVILGCIVAGQVLAGSLWGALLG